MKKQMTLIPLKGIEVNGAPISFGMSRSETERILGPADREHKNRRYYLGGELALDFDGANGIEFIEFLGGSEGALSPELYGLPVFDTDAGELLALLEEKGGESDDLDGGYTVTVPALSVGLYREIAPADVEELVRAMAKMDVTTLSHVNLADEQRRAARWETVGIGKEHYYA